MKILFVVDGRIPSKGGAEKQSLALAGALTERGHQVDILAPILEAGQQRYQRVNGISICRIKFARIKPIASIFLGFKTAIYLYRHGHEYDVIHIHMLKVMAAMVGFFSSRLAAPTIGKAAGDTELNRGVLDSLVVGRWDNRIYTIGLKKLDAYQVISQHINAQLIKMGYESNKCHLIPNGVNLAPRQTLAVDTVKNKDVVIGFTGRLEQVKGLKYLIQAFAAIKNREDCQDFSIKLLIVGDGLLRQELEAQVTALGLAEDCEFTGYVESTREVLKRIDIYVQPSLREGLPNALIEAMSQGIASVATRISGNEDVIESGVTGYLVPVKDVTELSTALIDLIKAPETRIKFGDAGAVFVRRHFNMEMIAEQWESTYQRLIEAKRAKHSQA